jgi:paraquat-inducible protein A
VAVTWVLLGLRLRWAPRHLVPVFTWVERLSPWSMIEVFMLGVFVAYTKLNDLAPVHMGLAVYALGGLMVAMAATDSALDHEAIWERLERPDLARRLGEQPGRPIGCDVCGAVMHEQPAHPLRKCARCGGGLRHRKPDSLTRAWALLLAAAVLYIPANTLPVLTLVRLGQGEPSTILGGVQELATEGQWPLAVLVFVASIAVPVLKLGGLTVLLVTTQLRMAGHLGERTRLYRIVEAVGRWSMVDVHDLDPDGPGADGCAGDDLAGPRGAVLLCRGGADHAGGQQFRPSADVGCGSAAFAVEEEHDRTAPA